MGKNKSKFTRDLPVFPRISIFLVGKVVGNLPRSTFPFGWVSFHDSFGPSIGPGSCIICSYSLSFAVFSDFLVVLLCRATERFLFVGSWTWSFFQGNFVSYSTPSVFSGANEENLPEYPCPLLSMYISSEHSFTSFLYQSWEVIASLCQFLLHVDVHKRSSQASWSRRWSNL